MAVQKERSKPLPLSLNLVSRFVFVSPLHFRRLLPLVIRLSSSSSSFTTLWTAHPKTTRKASVARFRHRCIIFSPPSFSTSALGLSPSRLVASLPFSPTSPRHRRAVPFFYSPLSPQPPSPSSKVHIHPLLHHPLTPLDRLAPSPRLTPALCRVSRHPPATVVPFPPIRPQPVPVSPAPLSAPHSSHKGRARCAAFPMARKSRTCGLPRRDLHPPSQQQQPLTLYRFFFFLPSPPFSLPPSPVGLPVCDPLGPAPSVLVTTSPFT